ncbi:MAG: hypothetical protein Q9201_004171 [Fulgogasparrea decipioides]
MAPAKRQSLHLDLPIAHAEALPQVAALFLILFDVKAGSIPGLDIANSVEYKSLPSGLHNVQEDTVYFVHNDEYAGTSCFVNSKGAESERNALMLAVGALIPLSYGRLGKSWRHTETLKALARDLVKDPTRTAPLEIYWQEHQYREGEEAARPGGESPSTPRQQRRRAKSSPNGQPQKRNRAVSSASILAPPGQTLSAHHPALSLSTFLDTFGPLVFPLYKAALLRKRILLLSQAPVELACEFVYNTSVLSTLPSSLHKLLPLSPLPTRLRPLFSVGVHDIPILSGSRTAQYQDHLANEGQAYGWIACTTDDILSTKNNIYDILVTLPPSYAEQAATKVWPRIQGKQGVNVRGTQRDARRYRGLRRDLRNFRTSSSRPVSRSQQRHTDTEPQNANSESSTNLLLPIPSLEEATTTDRDIDSPPDNDDGSEEQQILEPQSWSALAYNSFMWWASAGEARTDREEESEYDSQLFIGLGMDTPSRGVRRNGDGDDEEEGVAGGEGMGLEMALIAYFHRFTVLILHTLSDIIDAADSDTISENGSSADNEQEITHERSTQSETGRGSESGKDDMAVIDITGDDMQKMGLDVWSESDRAWVEELVEFYWGRKARVKGGRVECCGVRVL